MRAKELALAEHDPMVGRTLEGRYTILARLGSGSMGTVYRARQHAMGREVAIKILRGDRAIDETAKARFMREARANSLLASPNTVTVFDFGQSESGEFYLAMEILEGESLGQRLTRIGKLDPAVAVDTARQALRSLTEAHAKGIIHRDLKPDNLFFARVITGSKPASPFELATHEEIVKVLDFGIAKMIDAGDEPMGVVETQAGTVFGTPRYMSPEQAQGKPLDARTDLYSLGVIVYQMLTGRPPFTDNDAVVVMARHIKNIPKRPNEANPEANVPKELEDVVMRSLAKDAKDRQASAEVFAGELLSALEAHGAATSGIRSSMTNAAGIRMPESMRPPPMPLPPPPPARRRLSTPLLTLGALPVVLFVAATAVYLGMRSGKPVAVPDPTTSAAVVASPATATVTATPPAPPPTTTTTPMPPTTAASALPDPDVPRGSTSAKSLHGKPGGRPPRLVPPRPRLEPATTAAIIHAPPPTPTATSSYGVFE